jgi:hypothetical protein
VPDDDCVEVASGPPFQGSHQRHADDGGDQSSECEQHHWV